MRNSPASAFAMRTADLHTTDIRSCCSRRRICKPLHVPNLRSERSFLHCQFHRYLPCRGYAAFQYTERRSTIDTWGGDKWNMDEHASPRGEKLLRSWEHEEISIRRHLRRGISVSRLRDTQARVYPSKFFGSLKCQRIRAIADQIRSQFSEDTLKKQEYALSRLQNWQNIFLQSLSPLRSPVKSHSMRAGFTRRYVLESLSLSSVSIIAVTATRRYKYQSSRGDRVGARIKHR